jgi:uncharacterized LabA/DUF88 family protein
MDIELAVNAMELADHIDEMVLFSGDGDFRSLVESVQRRGVRVTVVSSIATQPPMLADDLRRRADLFMDLAQLKEKIGRSPAKRAAPLWSRDIKRPEFMQRDIARSGNDDDINGDAE